MKAEERIQELLDEYGLPSEIMEHIGVDDGVVVYDLEEIESLLGEDNTSYGEVAVYEELGELSKVRCLA